MSPKAKQRAIRLALILSFVTGICLFLAGALRENIVYFKTPTELLALKEFPKKLRLGGLVIKGTLKSINSNHQFMVTDETTAISVKYTGRLPDLFREGQGIVAIGTYDGVKKTFIAHQLLAKHDQYYRPKMRTIT
jgi:cytochrome c-type biogenesis protein CcmE